MTPENGGSEGVNGMSGPIWTQEFGEGPLMAVAVHNGHDLRDEIADRTALDDAARLREEDPHTGEWTVVAPTRLVVHRSRFEVDLNRGRDLAVYRGPEDAWGLDLWKEDGLSREMIARSLSIYDDFYGMFRVALQGVRDRHGRFVVLDLHSYNHRRSGPGGPAADPAGNPQVNIGTRTMDREYWAPLVDRFIADLRAYDYPGGRLDVRENVKFPGRQVPRFVHENFPGEGCALAVEVKKFFMDEWTGQRDDALFAAVLAALMSTVPGMLEELHRYERRPKTA
jgi:hypothetical protein